MSKLKYSSIFLLITLLPYSGFAQWTTVGDEVEMTDPTDVVLIGTTSNTNSAKLNIVGSDNHFSLLRVEADYAVPASRELLRLEMPTTSSSVAQFIDMKLGSSTMFEVRRDGNVNINSLRTSGNIFDLEATDDLLSSARLIELTMPTTSSSSALFMELNNGSTSMFEVNRDGDVMVAGDIDVAGEFIAASDQRFKKNIQPMASTLSLVLKLAPVLYDFRVDQFPAFNFPKRTKHGFVAQDVEEVLPELVVSSSRDVTSTEGESFVSKSVNYMELIPILTKAIQEQQEMIEALQREVDALADRK